MVPSGAINACLQGESYLVINLTFPCPLTTSVWYLQPNLDPEAGLLYLRGKLGVSIDYNTLEKGHWLGTGKKDPADTGTGEHVT